MRTALRRGMALAASILAVAACNSNNGSTAGAKDDPNKPAVVKVPPVVLASDTAKPDTLPQNRMKMDAIRLKLAENYAVMSAAIAHHDARMLSMMYAPDAQLATSDSLFEGTRPIAIGLAQFGVARSVRSFDRKSSGFAVVDSTVTDSGSYVILSQRTGADSLFERGKYVTSWRMHTEPLVWAIHRDHLVPVAKHKK